MIYQKIRIFISLAKDARRRNDEIPIIAVSNIKALNKNLSAFLNKALETQKW